LSKDAQEVVHREVMRGGPRRIPPQTRTEWDLRGFPPSNFVH